ncbi:MAG: putative rRNA maturation factor [Chloroflexota bacterium]|nr:putative rRNA maturation factor [Chloroflexota bacterium]
MIHQQISDEFKTWVSVEHLHSYAQKTLVYLDAAECDLTVVIGSNADIQELNRDYRHIDAPTDVLSFVYDMKDPETNARYLGDIIISAEKLKEQAEQAGHSVDKELCTLIVHGVLHLYGYDHETEEGDPVMMPLQDQIIASILVE